MIAQEIVEIATDLSITIFAERYTAQTVLRISLVVAGVLLAVLYGKPNLPQVIEEAETTLV